MKKNLFPIYALCGMLCFSTFACGGDDGDDNDIPPIVNPDKPDDKPINPDKSDSTFVANAAQAQKELEAVAKAVQKAINASDYQELANFAKFCSENLYYDFEEDKSYAPPLMVKRVANRLKSAAGGNVLAFASRSVVNELIQASDYYGAWQWNEKTEQWQEMASAPKDGAVFYFVKDGQQCEVRITESSKKTSVVYKDDEGNRYTVMVPESAVLSVKEGSKELASAVVNVTKCAIDGSGIALNSTVKMGQVNVAASFADNNTAAAVKAKMMEGNDVILEAEGQLKGNNLADADAISSADENSIQGMLNELVGKVTLMNSCSIYLSADNQNQQLSREIINFEGYYYGSFYRYEGSTNWLTNYTDGNKNCETSARNLANVMNQKTKAQLQFKNGSYTAPIEWSAYEAYAYEYETYDQYYKKYWRSEEYDWYVQPIICFDGGKFSFEEYFTESRFANVIDIFEALCSDFENLVD